MKKRIKLYFTVKQLCIVLDALELYEKQVESDVIEEIDEMAAGLGIAMPVEFLYPPNERERINAEYSLAPPGKRWIGKFNATYPERG